MFGERLQELRKDKGWTQKDLAAKLSLSWITISSYETGQSMPNSDTLRNIAVCFDVSLDYLFDLIDHPVSYRRERLTEEIRNYHKLEPSEQHMVDLFIEFLLSKKKQ